MHFSYSVGLPSGTRSQYVRQGGGLYYKSVRCRDVSRGTCSQFEQPASCGWGIEWHESGAKLAVETEIFMYFYASSILVRIHTLPQYKQFYSALYLTGLPSNT